MFQSVSRLAAILAICSALFASACNRPESQRSDGQPSVLDSDVIEVAESGTWDAVAARLPDPQTRIPSTIVWKAERLGLVPAESDPELQLYAPVYSLFVTVSADRIACYKVPSDTAPSEDWQSILSDYIEQTMLVDTPRIFVSPTADAPQAAVKQVLKLCADEELAFVRFGTGDKAKDAEIEKKPRL